MPITVITPEAGNPFGPGFYVEWFTTFVGPLAPGSYWQITLNSLVSEDQIARKQIPYSDATQDTIMTTSFVDLTQPVAGKWGWSTGDSAQLEILLVEPGFGTAETQTVNVTLDRESGQVAELAEWIKQRLDAQPVGLTTPQGEQLARVEAGLAVGLGVLPVDLVGGLADALINGPGLSVGSLSAAYTLIGDGEMPDIGTTFKTRLGIYFVATVIPAGLGHRHGQSEEYPSRLVQWRTIHSVGGSEMVTEVLDFDTHGEIWRWREAKPLRIEYSVLPGVTLSARWHWWP